MSFFAIDNPAVILETVKIVMCSLIKQYIDINVI